MNVYFLHGMVTNPLSQHMLYHQTLDNQIDKDVAKSNVNASKFLEILATDLSPS